MGARLERHVQRRPGGALARLSQRDHLRVVDCVVLVPAFADDFVPGDDHGADERMVCDLAAAALGERESALHVCGAWHRCFSSGARHREPSRSRA